MLKTRIQQDGRRGVVLIIALGLLALFAAVGISFAVIAKYERTAARNFKFFYQKDPASGQIDIPPRKLAEFGISQLIYDTRRTNSALRGHSLLRDMYGSPKASPYEDASGNPVPGADPEADNYGVDNASGTADDTQYVGSYNGNGIFAPLDLDNALPLGDGASAPGDRIIVNRASPTIGTLESAEVAHFISRLWPIPYTNNAQTPVFMMDPLATAPNGFYPRYPHNFTIFDPLGTRVETTDQREPERYGTAPAGPGNLFFGFDEDYDYADYNNWFLAMERADGQIIMPSFHRPHLVRQIEDVVTIADGYPAGGGGVGLPDARRRIAWKDITMDGPGHGLIFRPREVDVNASVVFNDATRGNRWRDLLDLDNSGAVGDSPEELDVDTDGDGKKDAIWIDLGYEPENIGGRWVKPLFAFKVLSLDGKINLNAHGNYVPKDLSYLTGGPADTGFEELHHSNLGASTYEVNPKHALLLGTNNDPLRTTELPLPEWQLDASGGGVGPVEYKALLGVLPGQTAAGRYTVPSADAQFFDGPGISRTDATTITLPGADDNRDVYPETEYDDDGNTGIEGRRDLHGVGRYFEPFNMAWEELGGAMTYTSLQGYLLNYPGAPTMGNGINLAANRAFASGGSLVATAFTQDDSIETDLYALNNTTDTLFSASDIERLYRAGDIDTSALSPRMANLVNHAFGDPEKPVDLDPILWSREQFARQRMRRMFTHASWDLNRFSFPPIFTAINDAGSLVNDDYSVIAGDQGHRGQLQLGTSADQPPAAGDAVYLNDLIRWVHSGLHTRLNLSGPDYDDPNVSNNTPDLIDPLRPYTTDPAEVDRDRTRLAAKIYVLLYLAVRPNASNADLNGSVTNAHEGRCRALAQLAVNIVDYMDADNVQTILPYQEDLVTFIQSFTPDIPTGYTGKAVIGFELPQVVVNEVNIISYRHNDGGAYFIGTDEDRDSVWAFAELRNISNQNVPLDDVGTLRTDHSAYQLRIIEQPPASSNPPVRVQIVDFHYPTGTPANPTIGTGVNGYLTITPPPSTGGGLDAPAHDPNLAIPDYGAATPRFVPANPILFPTHTAAAVGDVASESMRYERAWLYAGVRYEVGIYRLRNPNLPYNADSNPYVQQDHVTVDAAGNAPGTSGGAWEVQDIVAPATPDVADRLSRERTRVWQGELRQWVAADFDPASSDIEMERYLGDPKPSLPPPTPSISGFQPATAVTMLPAAPNTGSSNFEVTFPFLNRRLATPLELLSVRLYGCHRWQPYYPAATPPPPGTGIVRQPILPTPPGGTYPIVFGNEEWKLRFTDDFAHDGTTRNHRDRPVPWFEDNRYEHPTTNGTPVPPLLPDLFRFFEFVECRSRNSGAEDPVGTDLADPIYPRQVRVPGKICLNTITDEEVFRALFDDPWVMPSQGMDASQGRPITPPNRLPTNYWDTTSTTYNPVFKFDPRKNLAFGRLFDSRYKYSYDGTRYFSFGSGSTPVTAELITNQWPGIATDLAALVSAPLPGRNPTQQVHSEMFRMYLLSLAGADGIVGTGDDKPFRSFLSPRISDTLLRQRNYKQLASTEGTRIGDTIYPSGSGEYIVNFVEDITTPPTLFNTAPSWVPRLFDPVPNPFYFGDPADNANFTDTYRDEEMGSSLGQETPADFSTTGPLMLSQTASDVPPGAKDAWMLEHERNRLLGKIAGNVTTRSHVYACWMTVGFFDVEPGTENAQVPCLNEEIGIDDGTNVRHRMFFIVDRSKATKYEGPPATDKTLDEMASEGILTLPGRISFIE